MTAPKTFDEINEKIAKKQAVVLTAEQMSSLVAEEGPKKASEKVDVVTTGTFAPMCSSGAVINIGHTTPRMRVTHATLNGVPAYGGVAAVDLYVGATAIPDDHPANAVFPGRFEYGGGHVIEDLVRGNPVVLDASSYGTDDYPLRRHRAKLTLDNLRDAWLFNPRNAYQNYNVAVNASARRPIYTYLGVLRPRLANAGYCSAGCLSPLLNDPEYRTVGIGTRIFLGGGVGYVAHRGTQFAPDVPRTERGVPMEGAATLALVGDLKGMSAEFLRGAAIRGYGTSLTVGVGIPIPVLDEEMARATGVRDQDILAPVLDYASDYPANEGEPIAHVSYAELRSGTIELRGQKVRTGSLSSLAKAREVASQLKSWIEAGQFLLGRPVDRLHGHPPVGE
jgi:uncharacterized protein (DUF39 family)